MGHHHQLGSTGYRNADKLLSNLVDSGLGAAAAVRTLSQVLATAEDESVPPSTRLERITQMCNITLGPKVSHHVVQREESDEDVSAGQA